MQSLPWFIRRHSTRRRSLPSPWNHPVAFLLSRGSVLVRLLQVDLVGNHDGLLEGGTQEATLIGVAHRCRTSKDDGGLVGTTIEEEAEQGRNLRGGQGQGGCWDGGLHDSRCLVDGYQSGELWEGCVCAVDCRPGKWRCFVGAVGC